MTAKPTGGLRRCGDGLVFVGRREQIDDALLPRVRCDGVLEAPRRADQ